MPTIDMIATGNRIRDLRDRTGMTTKDLMRFFGFENPTAIYKWLRGDSLPTVDNLVILAHLFGVAVDDILVIRKNDNTAVA
ncbi:MAG: helix-turn-helix domain-containing protein [Lachnospiraceae bacterium]|nr:helix-turn-helix domain-containing protein [Lachnospiraceae bacterium]